VKNQRGALARPFDKADRFAEETTIQATHRYKARPEIDCTNHA
jgi:hypothetical protein